MFSFSSSSLLKALFLINLFWKSNESVLSLDDLRKNKLRCLSCMRCRVIYWAFFCVDSKFKLFLPSLTSPSQSFDVYLVCNSMCFESCNRRQDGKSVSDGMCKKTNTGWVEWYVENFSTLQPRTNESECLEPESMRLLNPEPFKLNVSGWVRLKSSEGLEKGCFTWF